MNHLCAAGARFKECNVYWKSISEEGHEATAVMRRGGAGVAL